MKKQMIMAALGLVLAAGSTTGASAMPAAGKATVGETATVQQVHYRGSNRHNHDGWRRNRSHDHGHRHWRQRWWGQHDHGYRGHRGHRDHGNGHGHRNYYN